MASRLDFTYPTALAAVAPLTLPEPPQFALSPPDAGWIVLTMQHTVGNPSRVAMSYLYPPLMPLWVWSVAVAWKIMPATLRIDEEGSAVYFIAEASASDELCLTIVRTSYGWDPEPETVLDAITWREARLAFLTRWGRLWASFMRDETMRWHEWRLVEGQLCPEPAREMPWDALPGYADVEFPLASRAAMIGWLWQTVALSWRTLPKPSVQHSDGSALRIKSALMAASYRLECLAHARTALGLRGQPDTQLRCCKWVTDALDMALYGPGEDDWVEAAKRRVENPLWCAARRALSATRHYVAQEVAALRRYLPVHDGARLPTIWGTNGA